MTEPQILSAVALLADIPEKRLSRGQVGTIVDRLAPDVFEVEFSDDEGRTYADAALKSNDFPVLRHQPDRQAA